MDQISWPSQWTVLDVIYTISFHPFQGTWKSASYAVRCKDRAVDGQGYPGLQACRASSSKYCDYSSQLNLLLLACRGSLDQVSQSRLSSSYRSSSGSNARTRAVNTTPASTPKIKVITQQLPKEDLQLWLERVAHQVDPAK